MKKCTCREDNIRDWRWGHGVKGRIPDPNCPIHTPAMRTIYNNDSFLFPQTEPERDYSGERG